MRKIGAILLVIICLAILAISYSTWKEKIGSAAEKPQEVSKSDETSEKAEKKPPEKSVTSLTKEDLESLSAGIDKKARLVLLDKYDSGEKAQLLIVGSNALDSGEPGYAELLKEELDRAYKGFIETTVVSFNGTSAGFMNEDTDLSAGYDVVLMEPFTLRNNDIISVEEEQQHIREFIGKVRSEEKDAALILQPPQPIYGAGFYTFQVNSLEKFAAQQQVGYINHWSAWPATTDEALQDFLTEDDLPNSEGAKVWASALTEYFITE